jgi:TRAP-type mannitol/chloroaromatic compound transport system substrate-binding protein
MKYVDSCVALIIVLCFSITTVQAKKLLLKTPIAFGSNLPGLGTTIKYVSERLDQASSGQIKMKIYEPGKLVSAFEILDAVSTGKVQAGYAVSGYWSGKMPAAPLFSTIPFGPEAGEYLAWMKFGGGQELYQKMYDQGGYKVKVLPCALLPPETSGWYVKPINKMADLKGRKIRYFGLGGEVLKKVGASTTLLPGPEVFPALEKGVIDGAEYSTPVIDEKLGFYKVAKYIYFPSWHQQATFFELLINKDTWNKAGKGHQALIEMACNEALSYSLAQGEALQFDALNRMKNKGVKITRWSPEMLQGFKKAWDQVAKEQSEKDKFFKEVFTSLSTFRKKL